MKLSIFNFCIVRGFDVLEFESKQPGKNATNEFHHVVPSLANIIYLRIDTEPSKFFLNSNQFFKLGSIGPRTDRWSKSS